MWEVTDPVVARASRTPPSDQAAHADLLAICETCSPAEIGAVLARLRANTMDGYYVEHCFAGIVAVERGLHPFFDWGNRLPAVSGHYHDWEWGRIWPEGPKDRRGLLEEWLVEAIEIRRESAHAS